MAVGDVKSSCQSIATNSAFTIQPPAGEEWIIHTVDLTYNFLLKMRTATVTASVEIWGAGHWNVQPGWHLTNSVYIEFINTDTVNGRIAGYTGMQTK